MTAAQASCWSFGFATFAAARLFDGFETVGTSLHAFTIFVELSLT